MVADPEINQAVRPTSLIFLKIILLSSIGRATPIELNVYPHHNSCAQRVFAYDKLS